MHANKRESGRQGAAGEAQDVRPRYRRSLLSHDLFVWQGGATLGSRAIRYLPIIVSLTYLLLTSIACVPMFRRPDSPLSGVVAVILTLPWSFILGIPVALLKPNLLNDLVGVIFLIAAGASLNAVLLFWVVWKGGRQRGTRAVAP